METDNIRSKISSLSRRLNTDLPDNNIKRRVEEVRNAVAESNETMMRDAVDNRREKSKTNHEIGSSEYPDNDIGKKENIVVSQQSVEELRRCLSKIIKDVEDLSDEINDIDIDELSKSMSRTKEEVFGVKDDLSFTLMKSSEEPHFVEYANRINGSSNVDQENIDNLEESLDRVLESCKNASRSLSNIEVPDIEKVKEEANETRARRAEREMEEMKPFMDLRKIKSTFSPGQVFTPEELAEDSYMSKSSAKEAIENAMEVSDYGDGSEIKKVGGDTYKLVDI